MSTVKMPIHLVLLERNNDVLPLQVLEHELPIINLLHGPGRTKMEEKNYSLLTLEDDATAEFNRLVKKWEQNSKDIGTVAKVYPTVAALAAQTGLRDTFDPLTTAEGPVMSGTVDMTRAALKAEAEALASGGRKKGKKAPAPDEPEAKPETDLAAAAA